jgi:hypothetical protein
MVIASFLSGFYKRLVEGQQRRAKREIAQYRHLLPRELEASGDKLIERNEDALPFGR